jgi:hypothetical protein
VLHPVGKLPAAVYWRRRALVLLLLVSVLGGGGWFAATGIGRWRAHAATAAAASTTRPVPTPALEQVVPSPAGLQASASAESCTDAMIGVSVRAPARAATGAAITVELVVTNTSASPCLQALDQALQEIVLLDAHGARVWGSDDCSPPSGSDARTLAPGQPVSFAHPWDGLTSEPTCAARRVPPPAGQYVLRARLGTVVSADAPLTLA